MDKQVRILPMEGTYGVQYFRDGHRNAQGWPAEHDAPKRRATCRCCAKPIPKGEPALRAWVKWTDTNNAWAATPAWLHLNCEHAGDRPDVRVVKAGDY